MPSQCLAVAEGSNGKTTTKELARNVLSKKFKIHATEGNLNNHIGVPLTILSTPDDAQVLIVEMGANHQGEIDLLCQIAAPNYGMITNIGKAHLEGFGGVEGIKLEQTSTGAVGGSFTGNTISAAAAGINVARATLSSTNPLTITGNNVTVSNQVIGGTSPTAGISLTNVTGSAAATIGTNTIAGRFYGYGIFNLNTTAVTSINGGTITGVMQGVG